MPMPLAPARHRPPTAEAHHEHHPHRLRYDASRLPRLRRLGEGGHPGGKRGLRSQAFAQAADLTPTILEAAGVEVPADCHGKSLIPVLTGKKRQIRDLLVSSWPITTNPNAPRHTVITNKEWSLHYNGRGGKHELYNLKEDPAQSKNLYRQNKDVAAELVERHLEYLREWDCPEEKVQFRSEL